VTAERVLANITAKCDIYFEDSLISRERIIEKYVDFFTSALSDEEHRISIALHTGSICFEVLSVIVTALACISFDCSDTGVIIDSLNIGDMVMYGKNKKERYVFSGFLNGAFAPVVQSSTERQYIQLEQPEKSTRDKVYVPKSSWGLVIPYSGQSRTADGRGIKQRRNNRTDFISYVFGTKMENIPSITGTSAIIVADRSNFERIAKGVKIIYNGEKSIDLLDLVTAAYYTDGGENYQYGSNPAKSEPVLKITGRISTARSLVLDKRGNKVVGFMVVNPSTIDKGNSELADVLGRKSLKFSHISGGIDIGSMGSIANEQGAAFVFACTKEFLLQNSLPLQETNSLTVELDRQIERITNNMVTVIQVEGGFSWEDFRKIRESLYTIRKSDWNEDLKQRFVITSHALLNLLITAVFSMNTIETAVTEGIISANILPPIARIQELKSLTEYAGKHKEKCAYIVDMLERMYYLLVLECSKYNTLKNLLEKSKGKKVAVVIPKAFYADILLADKELSDDGVTYITANRFNGTDGFDEVIVVGDFNGKRFDPLKCTASDDISVLLYDCETRIFKHKERNSKKYEKALNSRLGIGINNEADDESAVDTSFDSNLIDKIEMEGIDLDKYVADIGAFDVAKFASRNTGSPGNIPTAEVYVNGRFTSGEQILFSKYYTAVVYDPVKGRVEETDVDRLDSGDLLVFTKRDDYTRNMVDFIYENLLTAGRLSAEIADATEKAVYWKEVLREYKNVHSLSYGDLAARMRKLGSTLQEVSIRQWLIDESHIVGPRDEETLVQIAELTGDTYLLSDTRSYYNACRVVRRQRKKILDLISEAIADKLSGIIPQTGSELEIVFDNVERLSETLELEHISILDEPITVPINLINKPIVE